MKKLLIVLLSLGLVTGVSAQRGHVSGHVGGGVHYVRPRVYVGVGAYAPFYPYYGFGYGFGYSPFGYPYYPGYGYGYYAPSKLAVQISGIKSDYNDKIWSVKQDKSLSHKQRRQKIREFKHERDKAIDDAKRNYYKY